MSATGPHPQPSAEWVAGTVLSLGLRRLYIHFAGKHRPLVRRRIPDLGTDVFAEVLMLPSLQMVLRVCDARTGEVLAQSEPDDFTSVDMRAPNATQIFRDWCAARESGASDSDAD